MEKTRIRIFVDFWNFQLNWNDHHHRQGKTEPVPIPWKDTLPLILVAELSKGEPAKFAGCHFYASVDPSSPKDRKLNNYLHHVLSSFPGYAVIVKERRPRGRIRCQNEACRREITHCPHCQAELRGTVEKGIDAAILTDLMTMAFDNNYDQAILISGDADYIPAVEYIQKKTDKQIIQAFFKAHGDALRNVCWDHIFFEDIMGKLLGTPA